MFSQSGVKVFTSLTNIGSLAVGAFDLVDCSLSVVCLSRYSRELFLALAELANAVLQSQVQHGAINPQ